MTVLMALSAVAHAVAYVERFVSRARRLNGCASYKSVACFAMTLAAMPAASAQAVLVEEIRALHREAAERIALRDNHDILLARIGIRAADAALEVANAAPNPTLTIQTAGINPRLGIGSGDLRSKTVDTSVRIDQLFERGGKRALRAQSAGFVSDAMRYDAADATRQVSQAVRQSYFDLLAAREKVSLVQRSAVLYEQTMDAARKRARAGDLAPADVSRLSVDALRASNDVVQAQADVVRARRVLAALMGHPEVAEVIDPADPWPALVNPPAVDVEEIVSGRADVQAARLRIASAERSWRLALASRTRDVSVGIQADHYPTSAGNQQGAGNSFSISLQVPLFVQYDFNGEIRAADISLAMARQTYEKTRDAARSEVLRVLHDWRVAADRLTRYQEELLPAATRSAASAEFAFAHGALGIMDVLDVRRTLHQTEIETLSARVDFAKASTISVRTELEKARQ